MSKFNEKKKPVIPTAVNDMGEKAYLMDAKEALVATTLTTFLQNAYYETETEVIKRIKSDIAKTDPLFVAKLAVYLRQEANMRSVSHLLAGELAKVNADWKTRFFRKVLVRPDDMTEILAYYSSINKGKKLKFTNAIKKAFKSKLESMDAYLIDKYKMKNKDFKLVDLVNLFRPLPNEKNAEAYKRLINGESLDGLYDSKIFEKEMSKAGQVTAQSDKTVEEAKSDAIESVLSNVKGMPIFNLLRNLRNILETAPHMVDEACKQLTNQNKVENSRLLPFRFAVAYDEILAVKQSGATKKVTSKKSIVFEKDIKSSTKAKAELTETEWNTKKQQLLDAIETALEYSTMSIPELEGNVAVLVDHSGSVRGDNGGSGRLSAFGKGTKAMVGNLFGSMLAWRQDNVYIGNFGDRLINVPVNRKQRMLDFNKTSFDSGHSCGGRTENGLYIFLDKCIKEKTKVDYLCIFSDMVIGSGGIGGWDRSSNAGLGSFQELFKKFKAVNPQCKTICVNVSQTKGTSVFDKSLQVLEVAGWSDKIFDTIKSNCVGYKELIKQIEAIVI